MASHAVVMTQGSMRSNEWENFKFETVDEISVEKVKSVCWLCKKVIMWGNRDPTNEKNIQFHNLILGLDDLGCFCINSTKVCVTCSL